MRILERVLLLLFGLATAWFFLGWLLSDTQFRFMYDAGVDTQIIDRAKGFTRLSALHAFLFSAFVFLGQLVRVFVVRRTTIKSQAAPVAPDRR